MKVTTVRVSNCPECAVYVDLKDVSQSKLCILYHIRHNHLVTEYYLLVT